MKGKKRPFSLHATDPLPKDVTLVLGTHESKVDLGAFQVSMGKKLVLPKKQGSRTIHLCTPFPLPPLWYHSPLAALLLVDIMLIYFPFYTCFYIT